LNNDPPFPDSGSSFNFELFFELSADLLCIASFDGYFKKINPSVSKLLGYTNEELFSRPIHEFIYADDKQATRVSREIMLKNNPLLNFENRYVTKSGEIVWLSWTSMPVESDKLVFAIAKNITPKKRLEEERNLLLANLTKINKDLNQLTYITSHDLRSPVNNLLSIFDLLDVSKINDPETLEWLNILKLQIEGLKQTLNEYVDNLVQKDEIKPPIEELDFNQTLSKVLHSIHFLIETSKVTIHADFSALEKVKFNKTYLESIFLNLITNSIKYARHDCLPIISIYSKKIKGINQLVISDNGMGLDMTKIKKNIFGLNQKFHAETDSKGVGLYLVYNHVTSLGGHIDVKSKINKGLKFIISFKD
jgi:PAS domain S-box-containing protein